MLCLLSATLKPHCSKCVPKAGFILRKKLRNSISFVIENFQFNPLKEEKNILFQDVCHCFDNCLVPLIVQQHLYTTCQSLPTRD